MRQAIVPRRSGQPSAAPTFYLIPFHVKIGPYVPPISIGKNKHDLRVGNFLFPFNSRIIWLNWFVFLRERASLMDARLLKLRHEIRTTVSGFAWHKNIKGLTLRADNLRTLGASEHFLDRWENGHALNLAAGAVETHANHKSLATNVAWADVEWSRLEALGKIEFFPPGVCPPNLHVNPCALLLKERPDTDAATPDAERFKARLLCDLLRSHINERLPKLSVNYGTVDLALSRMRTGVFLFVIDFADCFFHWKLSSQDSMNMGFFSPPRNCYRRYLYLAFGLGSAPAINDESVKEILRLLELHTTIQLTDFVDDLLGNAPSELDAWAKLERAIIFSVRRDRGERQTFRNQTPFATAGMDRMDFRYPFGTLHRLREEMQGTPTPAPTLSR